MLFCLFDTIQPQVVCLSYMKVKRILKKVLDIFYENQTLFSDINGQIKINRFFRTWEICFGGCIQSGWYMNALWEKVLSRVPKKHPVKKFLILGLGAGGVVNKIKKRFPKATITAVEYDPVLIEIAKKTYLNNQNTLPEIILADAVEVMNNLTQKFDVIIIDLFKGNAPSKNLSSDTFAKKIADSLESDGYLLLNLYRNRNHIQPIFEKFLSNWEKIRYSSNQIFVYRHFGQGKIGDPIHIDYKNKEQSKIWSKTLNKKIVSQELKILGTTKKIANFCFEHYIGNQEPTAAKDGVKKIITWQSLNKIKAPIGWRKNYFAGRPLQNGIAILDNNHNYQQNWSNHVRRHQKKWQKQNQYELVEVDGLTFIKAYRDSKVLDFIIREGFVRVIKYHLKTHPENLIFIAAKNKENKKIMAGLAVINYPDISLSTHLISFINHEAKKTSVGVGLIDYWFQLSLQNKIRFLNFGIVWKKGDPRSWQGYSNFKKQFGLHLINYPRPFFKIIF